MKNNYKNFKLKTAFALLAFLGFQHNVMAQTTIKVSEDSYVTGQTKDGTDLSDTNYGDDVEGQARDTTTTAPRITYLKFPLSSITEGSVSNAKIKFYIYLPSTPSIDEILQIHKVPNMMDAAPNTWAENTVTYNTRPKVNPIAIGDVTVESVQKTSPNDYSKSYELDVTSYVNDALGTSATDISFAIKATPDDIGGKGKQVRIGTKEAGTDGEYGSTLIINSPLGVDDISNNQSPLQVYPNPTTSSFTLNRTFKSSDVLEVSVFNLLGAKVSSFNETVQPGVWKKEFNTQQLNMVRGLYLLKVSSKVNGTSVSKLVVK